MNLIKVLSIDFGEKRIGLAVGDTESKIVSPLKTIKNSGYENNCNSIKLIVKEWGISRIIIGIPELYKEQEINKKIVNFSKILKKNLNLDVIFYNEDFSSNYAQAELAAQMKAGRKKKINKEEIDRIAAALILQSYFENEIFKRPDTGITSKD
jgi:putative Holliday junction resolvase